MRFTPRGDIMNEASIQASPSGEISPGPIVEAILGYQKTAALKAAIELDLVSEIAAGATTPEQLAAATGASARGLRILCDYLTVHGFLEKSGGRYSPTPSSGVFLNRRSPAYMGSVADFLASPEMTALFLDDPAAYVRNGGSLGLANMAPDNPVWIKFAEAMVPFVASSAAGLAREIAASARPPKKVLDIAAGHGLFGISIAQAVPGAEIVAVDWGAVMELAARNASAAGIASRYRALSGSAFDVDWGDGYDLVLVPNFLHHFDMATCTQLLAKIRASLAPQGRTLAIEFVPNEDRVSPPFPASFAMMMLGTTPKGDAFPPSALEAIAKAADYAGIAIRPLPPSPASVVEFL